MRYVVSGEHLAFYEKWGYIEFESLISETEASLIRQEIHTVFSRRKKELSSQSKKIDEALPFHGRYNRAIEEAHFFGRDILKDSPSMQKILFSSRLTKIAGELSYKKELRYGFDQVFATAEEHDSEPSKEQSIFENSVFTLADVSCIKGLIIAAAICVEGALESSPSIPEENKPIKIFPDQLGNVLFFSCTKPIDISDLLSRRGQRFVLLAFAQKNVQYLYQIKDPHVHALKQSGYVFGDSLNEKTHPTLYRRTGN
jgi:hypothetical protein